MTIQEAYREGRKDLREAGIAEADLDAWYLLEYVSGISRTQFYSHPEKELSEEEKIRYAHCLRKRRERVPIQHITGTQEFMGLPFLVNDSVLIPRQDTEILVEEGLKLIRTGRLPCYKGQLPVLDLCTGSACVLLSILHHATDEKKCVSDMELARIQGVGADISEKALNVAAKNAHCLGISAQFVKGDLFENVSGRFSMILSNPPYIPTEEIDHLQEEVRFYDPRIALDGKEDGLFFYRSIIGESKNYLLPGGYLIFEIGSSQANEVAYLMSQAGYGDIVVKKDLAGLDRVVSGRYIK